MQHDPLPTLPALAAWALSTVPGRLAIAVFVLLGVVDLARYQSLCPSQVRRVSRHGQLRKFTLRCLTLLRARAGEWRTTVKGLQGNSLTEPKSESCRKCHVSRRTPRIADTTQVDRLRFDLRRYFLWQLVKSGPGYGTRKKGKNSPAVQHRIGWADRDLILTEDGDQASAVGTSFQHNVSFSKWVTLQTCVGRRFRPPGRGEYAVAFDKLLWTIVVTSFAVAGLRTAMEWCAATSVLRHFGPWSLRSKTDVQIHFGPPPLGSYSHFGPKDVH